MTRRHFPSTGRQTDKQTNKQTDRTINDAGLTLDGSEYPYPISNIGYWISSTEKNPRQNFPPLNPRQNENSF